MKAAPKRRRTGRRKTFEQLARTRTKRRLETISRLAAEICCDWAESELGVVEFDGESLVEAIRHFEETFDELWADFAARELSGEAADA